MNSKTTAQVPPMGWNSWNTFYDCFDDKLIMETADILADQGYLESGYEYLILDDCWMAKERGKDGNLVPDPAKFPNGIEPVIEYVHRKGLKFGLYECCGVRTCAGYPGSFEHETADADLFASWGVDYLKYDNCHRPSSIGSELLYRRMGLALRSSGKDILLAACQWGMENVGRWIRSTGAHTYRSTIDIRDNWDSIKNITEERLNHLDEGTSGCFNDMDMLVVGMHGGGVNPETSSEGCTFEEYQTHFALWAFFGSPLIIGCDLRAVGEEEKRLLTNKDLIAINQDPEGRTCYTVRCSSCTPEAFTLIKPLANGDYAVGIFNFGEEEVSSGFPFWEIGFSAWQNRIISIYDCLKQRDLGVFSESFSTKLKSHGCGIFRISVKTSRRQVS